MKLDTGQKFAVQVLYTGMKTHRIYTNDNLLVCFILQVGGKVSGLCVCVFLIFWYLVSSPHSLTHSPFLRLSYSKRTFYKTLTSSLFLLSLVGREGGRGGGVRWSKERGRWGQRMQYGEKTVHLENFNFRMAVESPRYTILVRGGNCDMKHKRKVGGKKNKKKKPTK